MTTVTPNSIAEAEQLIRGAWAQGRRVSLDSGGEADFCLSLAGLDRIETLNVDDGVAVVEAGVRVQRIRVAASAVGLWCPALRHLPADEPIGAAVSGAHGWRSRRYGALADYLLGSGFMCPSSGFVRHGGTAIKNATGYNLTAILAGSRGAFGIILSINLRLIPLPRAQATRSYRVPASRVAVVAAALAGTTADFSPSRFDADSVLARIQPGEPDSEILVETSDASPAGLAARVNRLDAEALRHGAQLESPQRWPDAPDGIRTRHAATPRELPHFLSNLHQTLGPNFREIRFEATGGGIELWLPERCPRRQVLPSPPEALTRLRAAFRKAVDPDGLVSP